jgi:hypothetical protein
MVTLRRPVLGVLAVFLLAGPVRADLVDVTTEQLQDGWTRYSYTIHDFTSHGITSFVLQSPFFDQVRALTQPASWMGLTMPGVVSFGRDIPGPKTDTLVFSFESPHLPATVDYRIASSCTRITGCVIGPGPGTGTIQSVKTPEPTALALFGVGGLCCWMRRRWRREPG